MLALPLVNIGGIDIVNGQHKLLLAILWQLMRFNIRGLLQVSFWDHPTFRRLMLQCPPSCHGPELVPLWRAVIHPVHLCHHNPCSSGCLCSTLRGRGWSA